MCLHSCLWCSEERAQQNGNATRCSAMTPVHLYKLNMQLTCSMTHNIGLLWHKRQKTCNSCMIKNKISLCYQWCCLVCKVLFAYSISVTWPQRETWGLQRKNLKDVWAIFKSASIKRKKVTNDTTWLSRIRGHTANIQDVLKDNKWINKAYIGETKGGRGSQAVPLLTGV